MNEQRTQQHIFCVCVCAFVYKYEATQKRDVYDDDDDQRKKAKSKLTKRDIHRVCTLHSINKFYLVWHIILQSKRNVKSSQSKQIHKYIYNDNNKKICTSDMHLSARMKINNNIITKRERKKIAISTSDRIDIIMLYVHAWMVIGVSFLIFFYSSFVLQVSSRLWTVSIWVFGFKLSSSNHSSAWCSYIKSSCKTFFWI